jgi:hypothetical protein
LRKVTPQREAAEALMQHDDRGRLVRGQPKGYGLQAFAAGQDLVANTIGPSKGGHCVRSAPGRASGRRSGRASGSGCGGAGRRRGDRRTRRLCSFVGLRCDIRWWLKELSPSEALYCVALYCMAGLVLPSASTCLLIVLPLS